MFANAVLRDGYVVSTDDLVSNIFGILNYRCRCVRVYFLTYSS